MLIASIVYLGLDLSRNGYFSSLNYISSDEIESRILNVSKDTVTIIEKFSEYREIDEAGDKGLLTQEGVDYLEKNQNYALSTVLLIFNQEAKFAKGGIQKYGHQEASVLKNIFDKGFINSDDSEKITLINMIVQGHLGESLFSEEEVRQYEQIKKTVMSDKDGFYYHFSLVDKYNEKYPFLKWL